MCSHPGDETAKVDKTPMKNTYLQPEQMLVMLGAQHGQQPTQPTAQKLGQLSSHSQDVFDQEYRSILQRKEYT